MTTRVIKIVIDSSGAKRGGKDVEKALDGVEKKGKKAGGAIEGVKGALIATAALLVAKKIISVGDAYASLQGQLRLVTSSTAELENVTKALFQISQKTRQELGATADLYIRLGRSTDFSNERILQLTETIGQTIALSRATPQAAQAALFQLGQGFAAGALRGEELNSVLEQTPELAKAISDGLGVTLGQLRILGAEGKLTAERVAEGLEASAAKVNSEFGSIPLTVGDAVTRVNNSMTLFIGTLDQATGATLGLAHVVNAAAEIIQGLGVILGDDKGFGRKAGVIGAEIEELEKKVDSLKVSANTGFESGDDPLGFSFKIKDVSEFNDELAKTEDELFALRQLQLEILANGGLTNAEAELKFVEDLRASIALTAQKANALFSASGNVNPLIKQIEDTEDKLKQLQAVFDKGDIELPEFNQLKELLQGSLGDAAQRQADVFAESFKTGADKAADSIVLLNDFVERNLIPPETAAKIREQLNKALGGEDDSEIVEKFVDSFKTAGEKAGEQIVLLDSFIKDNLIEPETAQKIRDRLEAIVAKELIIPVAIDVEAFQDAEQRIADLRQNIEAFNEGGAEGLSASESYQEARDIIAEIGDEATISVGELAKLIETEKVLTKTLSDQEDEWKKNADAAEDFFKRARENSQDILADFFAGGFDSLDDFETAFAEMLLNLASQALAAEIFNLILGNEASGTGGLIQAGISALGGFFGGAASGADVGAGDFGVVGEKGPEVFQAPTAGRIVPNATSAAPQVTVGGPTIVNTIDDGQIVSAFNRGGGDQAVLNIIGDQSSAVRQALGIQE